MFIGKPSISAAGLANFSHRFRPRRRQKISSTASTSIPLNIATILIGSTILGATENDQIHFFYHFQEGRWTGTTSGALRHALLIAGRPIVFATFINVSGFLALALSDLPPMREFGIVSSSAFVLALLADFTALPAALWILSRYDRRNVA